MAYPPAYSIQGSSQRSGSCKVYSARVHTSEILVIITGVQLHALVLMVLCSSAVQNHTQNNGTWKFIITKFMPDLMSINLMGIELSIL